MSLSALVDTSKSSLFLSLVSITFNPTVWNIVARNEYRNKTITHIFGGNAHLGCYFLAACIFSAGILRDHFYLSAVLEQPHARLLPAPLDTLIPLALFAIGQTFVVTSTWTLGITGTFLGDYFGILMDSRVEGFPFNVLQDPMYVGSTMCFAATALWYERPVGLLITLYVYVVYTIALKFEGPFTDMIYSKRSASTSSKKLFDKEL
ncbi:phospholipid methyltransferase [Russula ochroleuca]|uniref:Phosphatidyl-N-methylethanolamine N-methyltransferase n=1 Tax=Russula ochroleuca TaxID=152965 RepID=A0A9P5N6B7_9AGAM|nr:phospholipid methyltransferase [Russula ochroleuca]